MLYACPHAPHRAELMAVLAGKALHRAGPSPGWSEGTVWGDAEALCLHFFFSCSPLPPAE